MSYRWRTTQTSFGFGGSFGGRTARDVIVLVVVVLATYAMQFFASTALVPALLHLSSAVWRLGFVWQLVTYAFAGYGPASLWILLELLIMVWFGNDIFWRLGRGRFWRTLALAAGGAGVVAAAVQMLATLAGGGSPTAEPFTLMQGQRTLLVILITAFATLYAEATILLFFVLPVRARWFVWFGIAVGFIGFLSTHDIAGFAGICAATGLTVLIVSPGGPQHRLRRWKLRIQQRWTQWRLERARRNRGLRVLDGDRNGRVN